MKADARPFARPFEELVKETMSPELIRRSDELYRKYRAEMVLQKMREAQGMSQADVAAVLGVGQPDLSETGCQRDMKLSTLGQFVRALGGELRVTAAFPDGDIRLTQFEQEEV